MATSVVEQHRQWQEENPLRVWRKEQKVTIHAAASILGVSVSSIQHWEAGATMPSDELMPRLVATIGQHTPRRWRTWYDRNPAAAIHTATA